MVICSYVSVLFSKEMGSYVCATHQKVYNYFVLKPFTSFWFFCGKNAKDDVIVEEIFNIFLSSFWYLSPTFYV